MYSCRITKADQRINQTYGQRHFRCVIGNQHNFLNAYKYVYYNPVKAGICKRAEAYPYSTLCGLIGGSHLLIPVVDDRVLTEDVEGTLACADQNLSSPKTRIPKNRTCLKMTYCDPEREPGTFPST